MVTFRFLAIAAGCGQRNIARSEGVAIASPSVAVEWPVSLALVASFSHRLVSRLEKSGDEA